MPTTENMTDVAESLVGTWLLTAGTATRPTEWWAALASTVPTDTVAGTEFVAADYGRVAVVFTEDGVIAGRFTNSVGALAFGTPATDWGDAAGVEVYDDATAGRRLLRYTVSPAVACDAGAPVSIPIDSLVEQFD